jgi:hypothetical protein
VQGTNLVVSKRRGLIYLKKFKLKLQCFYEEGFKMIFLYKALK